MTAYAYFFVPETKGVELEEMGAVFGHPSEDAGFESLSVKKESADA